MVRLFRLRLWVLEVSIHHETCHSQGQICLEDDTWCLPIEILFILWRNLRVDEGEKSQFLLDVYWFGH